MSSKLLALQKELVKIQAEIEIEKQKDENWKYTKHPVEFNDGDATLTVKCNYENWKSIKENPLKYGDGILYLGILEDNFDGDFEGCIALTIEEIEELNNYLTKIINYMKTEEQ